MSADSKLGREVRSDCRSQSRRRRSREPGWRLPRSPSSRSPSSDSGGAGSHWAWRPSSSQARLPPLFNMITSSRQRSKSPSKACLNTIRTGASPPPGLRKTVSKEEREAAMAPAWRRNSRKIGSKNVPLIFQIIYAILKRKKNKEKKKKILKGM